MSSFTYVKYIWSIQVYTTWSAHYHAFHVQPASLNVLSRSVDLSKNNFQGKLPKYQTYYHKSSSSGFQYCARNIFSMHFIQKYTSCIITAQQSCLTYYQGPSASCNTVSQQIKAYPSCIITAQQPFLTYYQGPSASCKTVSQQIKAYTSCILGHSELIISPIESNGNPHGLWQSTVLTTMNVGHPFLPQFQAIIQTILSKCEKTYVSLHFF